MVADFSQRESFGIALKKTFSGEYPCAMCLKIREGRQQEQKQEQQELSFKENKLSELFWKPSKVELPDRIVLISLFPISGDAVYSGFIDSPPTPPPRRLAVVL